MVWTQRHERIDRRITKKYGSNLSGNAYNEAWAKEVYAEREKRRTAYKKKKSQSKIMFGIPKFGKFRF